MKYLEHLLLLKSINGLGVAKINKNFCNLIPLYQNFDDFSEYLTDYGIVKSSDLSNAKMLIAKTFDNVDRNSQVSIITCFDENFPERFNLLGSQRPLYIYVAGDISILNDRSLAVVGTRKPSLFGELANKKIVAKVQDAIIVSGLALGTDRIAHEAAIDNGLKTIAVLPSGLSNITPSSNRQLANMIADGNGCLLSEYDPEEKPEKYTYVRRDSLIAAISDAIVVIECGEKSGTMQTVDAAIKMKKPIACYFTDRGGDYSGNKKLLDKGIAKRLYKPEEVQQLI